MDEKDQNPKAQPSTFKKGIKLDFRNAFNEVSRARIVTAQEKDQLSAI